MIVVPEGKFLHQIHVEEKFGSSLKSSDESKKRPTAAIGYNYEEDDDNAKSNALPTSSAGSNTEEDNDSESDVDLGLWSVLNTSATVYYFIMLFVFYVYYHFFFN